MSIAFSFIALTADSALAQKKGGLWAGDKHARKEYKREIKQARKEYRRDVREARRDYRRSGGDGWWLRNRQRRGYGYNNVRPYRGAKRAHYKGRLPRNYNSRYFRNWR